MPVDRDARELLTLADQLRLLAMSMPEEQARARLCRAFKRKEITYLPTHALSYEDAEIDWTTGQVTLRKPVRQCFIPTLTVAEFKAHFQSTADSTGTASEPHHAPATMGLPAVDYQPTGMSGPNRTRGRKPKVRERVKDAMRNAIREGHLSHEELDKMLEKGLKDRFSASRDTCRIARNEILTKLRSVENPISDK